MAQQSIIKKLLLPTVPGLNDLIVQYTKMETWKTETNCENTAKVHPIYSKAGRGDGGRSTLTGFDSRTLTCASKILHSASTTAPASAVVEHRDIDWILRALGSVNEDFIEGGKELKALAKLPGREFWIKNCGQIVSLLLERFHPPQVNRGAPLQESHASIDNNRHGALDSLPLTGLTPMSPPSVSASSPSSARVLTEMERLLIASKILLAIARYKGEFLRSFTELLVHRLCVSATYAPVAVTLHNRQVLAGLAPHDGQRLAHFLLPFAKFDRENSYLHSNTSGPASSSNNARLQVQLLALQVLSDAVKFMTSAQLLTDILPIMTTVVPSLDSALVGNANHGLFLSVAVNLIFTL